MRTVSKEEYKTLMNNAGSIAKFLVQQIEDVKSDPDFYKSAESINPYKNITISDTNSLHTISFRLIDRANETVCLRLKTNEEGIITNDFEDTIAYYHTIGPNKKIKIYADYNELIKNKDYNSEIYFELLEDYFYDECGDMYGNGRISYEKEEGYKGRMYCQNNMCILEYGKYEYDHTTIKFPGETYESNTTIPEYKDLEKGIITYNMTQGINNAVFLVLNELQESKIRARSRKRNQSI